MKLVFATGNAHKLDEVRRMLGEGIALSTTADHGIEEEIPETEPTLEGNARLKARYVWEHTGLDCFADDTGLEVAALGGAPGVHSARYATLGHDFAANTALLLHNLQGVEDRSARFRTVICLILGGREYYFEGTVEGSIARSAAGCGGFGYDPVFVAKGFDRSFAEMSAEEKNAVSHRARAVERLARFLADLG